MTTLSFVPTDYGAEPFLIESRVDVDFRQHIYNSAVRILAYLETTIPGILCDSAIDYGCASGEWMAAYHTVFRTYRGEEKLKGIYGLDKIYQEPDVGINRAEPAMRIYRQGEHTGEILASADYFDFNQLAPASGLNHTDDDFIHADMWSARKQLRNRPKHAFRICTEVVEHLEADRALKLVQELISHSGPILFSAAVPGQPGHDHISPDWPSRWANLFALRGYYPLDIIRPYFWDCTTRLTPEDFDIWYAQNAIVFVHLDSLRWLTPSARNDGKLAFQETIEKYYHARRFTLLDKVHPHLHTLLNKNKFILRNRKNPW